MLEVGIQDFCEWRQQKYQIQSSPAENQTSPHPRFRTGCAREKSGGNKKGHESNRRKPGLKQLCENSHRLQLLALMSRAGIMHTARSWRPFFVVDRTALPSEVEALPDTILDLTLRRSSARLQLSSERACGLNSTS